MRRDNICKTQCSFALNSPGGFDPSSDQLQAPLAFSPQPAVQQAPPPHLSPQQHLQQQQGPPPPRQQQQQQQQTLFAGIRAPPPPPLPPSPPNIPRAPRPPLAPGIGLQFGASQQTNGPVPTGSRAPTNQPPPPPPPQVNPTRQPRPLFNFLPRLPNLSELFGL